MSRLTEELARFAAHPGFGALPQRAIDIVQSGFIDTIATMIAGRDEPVVGIVRRFVAERQSSAREASLLFGATMAASGLTAAPDALEHHAGYLAALSPKGRADRDSPPSALGTRLRILDSGLSIKKYPVCYATHRVIDGVLDLANAHAIRPEDVIAVRALSLIHI